ncbi:hypothetical protein MUGA111182_17880 [Mucilaginibacter galii]|uniref:Uncharacterized protein n=1 Tax=Mucilaginibacter galii TaxID=2005073 RepID=A0A917N309_9SPHI|nr:hypothetical protein [Mucilaginibacter galii]GGI52431.1 hypothetical protein GCM10011425_36430 [Mucilaginibacter galii]
MKMTINQGQIIRPTKQQWKLHQQLAQLSKDLNRLPDAREASRGKPRSVPVELLPMVF